MDPVTSEKNTPVFRYKILQNITAFFRLLEALVLTALSLWCSAHAADLVGHVGPILLGPRFLFLLANAIVLSLLLHSHPHTTPTTASISDEDISAAFAVPPPPDQVTPVAMREDREGEVVFEDKRVVSVGVHAGRTCGRSRSERMTVRRRGSPELRRSETDVGKETEKGGKEEGDDEFRRTIEAFIEKQWKFQEEESMAMAIVAAN